MKKGLVSIILVNLNKSNLTNDCIKSLQKNKYKNIEIILIDNGSADSDVANLTRKGVKLIEVGKNVGFARGINIGVENSKGEYILVLNNDLTVAPDFLTKMLDVLNSDKSIGLVNGRILKKIGKKIVRSRHNTISLTGTVIEILDLPYPNEEMFWARGGCILYRRKDFDIPFDPSYFIYFEDMYLSWLSRLENKKVVFVPDSELYHLPSATTTEMSQKNPKMKNFFSFIWERNRIMNLMIFYKFSTLVRVFPLILVSTLLLNISDPRNLENRLRAYFWVIRNCRKVYKKRRRVQKRRKVSDREILRYKSCKFFSSSRKVKIFSFINILAYIYCAVLFLRTREFYKHEDGA